MVFGMLQNERDSLTEYLNQLLKNEEKVMDDKIKEFYYKYKISLTSFYFPILYQEDFYLLFRYLDYGIYYNDIEECFGICKIENRLCFKHADFFESLYPTLKKFKEYTYGNKKLLGIESLLN